MVELMILISVGFTSGGLYLIGVKLRGLPRNLLSQAFGKLLECVGMTVIVFLVNGAILLVPVLMFQDSLAAAFPHYVASDVAVLALSFLQTVIFQWWGEAANRLRR